MRQKKWSSFRSGHNTCKSPYRWKSVRALIFVMEAILSQELDQKIFNYITALEKMNEELVKTLKHCVELLTQFKHSVRDPEGWQEMLDVFEQTIRVGESTVEEKTIH